jgi:hypothetical protein
MTRVAPSRQGCRIASGAAAAIVLLAPPDLLRTSASIVLLCVWKDWIGDWLPKRLVAILLCLRR